MAKGPAKYQGKSSELERVEPVETEHVKPIEKPGESAGHAKTDKAFLDVVDKHHEVEKTVRIRVQKGTDEINHEGVSYKVAQGPASEEWTVEVPAHVAEHILRQGGAVQLDVPAPDLGEGFIHVRHINDPKTGFSHGAKIYEPDKNGKIKVPVSILAEIEPHGFISC